MNQERSTRSVVSDADTESRNEEATEELNENRDRPPPGRNAHHSESEQPLQDQLQVPVEHDHIHRNPQQDDPFDGSSSISNLHVYSPAQSANESNNYLYSAASYPIPPPVHMPGTTHVPLPLAPQYLPPPGQHVLQFYEAQMRDHAAAYASAAAGAAWAAAQIAADMANASQATLQNPHIPRTLPVPPPVFPVSYPPSDPSMSIGPMPMPAYPIMDCRPSPPHPSMMDPFPYNAENHQQNPNHHYQQHHHQHQHPRQHPQQPCIDDGSFTSDTYGNRRRKRQQRMPPSDAGHRIGHVNPHLPKQSSHLQTEESRGCRRRFRPDGSSDNGSDSNYSQPQINNSKRRARIRKVMASSTGSSDGGSSGVYFNKKKKARQPNDDSLLGKTGVSALYEWCGKRRTTPTFTLVQSDLPFAVDGTCTYNDSQNDTTSINHAVLDIPAEEEKRHRGYEFEMTVSIDGVEWGKGRARTKSAAKQEAARRALQALLPGVAFDEASGILIHLPTLPEESSRVNAHPNINIKSTDPWKASASLEDLAPNLAKRLAIRHPDDDDCHPKPQDDIRKEDRTDCSKKRPSKWHSVYPCASTTTSDEEDENAYYASRGASVCSALLHAMVQIDDRIPEAPTYSYELAAVSSGNDDEEHLEESSAQLKRKAATGDSSYTPPKTPIQIHRGPFTCTATMRLRRVPQEGETASIEVYDIIRAVGVGGAKREAKHTASAKLLALLFPECDGMVQVKEAAEAARERYAASKALKQQSKRNWAFISKMHRWNQSNDDKVNAVFAMAPDNMDPPLPIAVEEHILRGLGVEKNEESVSIHEDSSLSAREASRQKQLDEQIALALQKLNERDDEGRSLPGQLSVDDVVGRTVLRRASSDDLHWITLLLGDSVSSLSPISILGQPSLSSTGEDDVTNDITTAPSIMWSSTTVVLLLCRAIAPYDDPPLGCAVLISGFSMEKGRLLRVAQIGSKPHLPRERFVECLQDFAHCMNCSLEVSTPATTELSVKSASVITIRQNEIQGILRSHLSSPRATELIQITPCLLPKTQKSYNQILHEESLVTAASTLQSVKEESEGVDDSGSESSPEKRVAKKDQDKPSKRSRVH